MNTQPLPRRHDLIPILFILFILSSLPAHANDPPKSPLSPTDALRTFHLDAGLRLELVATEPQIESPVAMAFDEDGKLWVVEMRDYPNGPAPGQPPEGRVKVLEDKDGDGRFETSRVFADQLLFANGLLPWKGGVFVTAAPHILYLKDTDGDGTADLKEVLFEGFAQGNPQLRVSYPMLGLDGWVYCCNGLRGGSIKRVKPSPPLAVPSPPLAKGGLGAPLNLSGKDFRFNPANPDQFEAISGMGQFGHTFDDWGNRFVCDNNHHLRHVVLEDRYLKRNPYLAVPTVLEDTSELEPGPLSSGGKIYPLTRNWTTSSLHAGRFTAACGVHIYRGSLLGEPYRGAAFTCDPTGNLVHMEILRPHGVTFRSKPHKQGVEFLASTDEWFRPVFLAGGPDGALYIVDMYRAVIEHPEFVPEELKKRPDLLLGKERGRIWRVVPERITAETQRTRRRELGKATTEELVKLLEHEEAWWRDTARRRLLENQDPSAVGPLRKLCGPKAEQMTCILAAHLLESLTALDDDTVLTMLGSTHAVVREHAVRFTEAGGKSAYRFGLKAVRFAEDPEERVRFQTAFTLGARKDKDYLDELAKIAFKDLDDPWTRQAVLSVVPERSAVLARKLLMTIPEGRKQLYEVDRLVFLRELATVAGARNDPAEVVDLLDALTTPRVGGTYPYQFAGLRGLAEGMGQRGNRLDVLVKSLLPKHERLHEYVTELLAMAATEAQNPPRADAVVRLDAIRLLAYAEWKLARDALAPLLTADVSQDLRLAAVRSLAAQPHEDVPGVLMQSWKSHTPGVRREVIEAMFRNPQRLGVLLNEIKAGRVKPGDIDAPRTRQLVNHGDAKIREAAKKLLQDNLPADRKEVLARYQAALKHPSDPKLGREVFHKHCATCHRVAGLGVDVGADIADTRVKTREQLLHDILHPNAAIDANYINYIVQTKAGRVVTGVIAAETTSSVTLKRAENQTESILRQDIDEMQSTGLSLMPDGFEKNITVAEMAHLLDFLKNWRYVDGLTPLSSPLSPLGRGVGGEGSGKLNPSPQPSPQGGEGAKQLRVEEKDDHLLIETDALHARINKKGYVSGIAQGSFIDKKTGAKEVGFGLHIMDFLLAPGWRDDGYTRDAKLHGNLPKHYVEGPQICTQAKELKPEIIRHKDFVAVRLAYTFHKPGAGYKAGSTWTQTLIFQPGVRYILCDEQIKSANDVDELFYRIDMPGHVKHKAGDTFEKVYLSYHGEISASEFAQDFAPDAKFLYQRQPGKIPQRMIRGYQVKVDGKPGPWLAGMTLDPAVVSEAWCHERGYICMIQENHRAKVKAGETFGAAYVVGWFDSVKEMEGVYDPLRGVKGFNVESDRVTPRR